MFGFNVDGTQQAHLNSDIKHSYLLITLLLLSIFTGCLVAMFNSQEMVVLHSYITYSSYFVVGVILIKNIIWYLKNE